MLLQYTFKAFILCPPPSYSFLIFFSFRRRHFSKFCIHPSCNMWLESLVATISYYLPPNFFLPVWYFSNFWWYCWYNISLESPVTTFILCILHLPPATQFLEAFFLTFADTLHIIYHWTVLSSLFPMMHHILKYFSEFLPLGFSILDSMGPRLMCPQISCIAKFCLERFVKRWMCLLAIENGTNRYCIAYHFKIKIIDAMIYVRI